MLQLRNMEHVAQKNWNMVVKPFFLLLSMLVELKGAHAMYTFSGAYNSTQQFGRDDHMLT